MATASSAAATQTTTAAVGTAAASRASRSGRRKSHGRASTDRADDRMMRRADSVVWAAAASATASASATSATAAATAKCARPVIHRPSAEQQRRRHRIPERTEHRELLLVVIVHVLRRVTLLLHQHRVSIVGGLVSFEEASAVFRIGVPVHAARRGLVAIKPVHRKLRDRAAFRRGADPDAVEARVLQHRFDLPNCSRLLGLVIAIGGARGGDDRAYIEESGANHAIAHALDIASIPDTHHGV